MNPKLETLSVFITAELNNPVASHCTLYDSSLKTQRPCAEKWDEVNDMPKCHNCFFAESNHRHGLAVSETIHESINKDPIDILK